MNYYEEGYASGKARGSWVTDGNTTPETYRWIREGYDNGDPEVMDLCPAPLSGEWAGESISEVFGLKVGEDYPDSENLDSYEEGYQQGFWDEVLNACNYQLEGSN